MAKPYRGYLSGSFEQYLEYRAGYYDKKIPYQSISFMKKVADGLLIEKEDGQQYILEDNINGSDRAIDLYGKYSKPESLIKDDKICGLRFCEIIGIYREDDQTFRILIMAPDEKTFNQYISNADLQTVREKMSGTSDGEILSTNEGIVVMHHFLRDEDRRLHYKDISNIQIFKEYGNKKYVIFRCAGRTIIIESSADSNLLEEFEKNYSNYAQLAKNVKTMVSAQSAYNSAGCRGIPMRFRQEWIDELNKINSMC